MAAPSNSQGLATHKSYKKRNHSYWGYLKQCVNSYILILFSIWLIASWIFRYKKRFCPLWSFSASADDRLQIGKSSVNSRNCLSSLVLARDPYTHLLDGQFQNLMAGKFWSCLCGQTFLQASKKKIQVTIDFGFYDSRYGKQQST